jgi:hypothetical protein
MPNRRALARAAAALAVVGLAATLPVATAGAASHPVVSDVSVHLVNQGETTFELVRGSGFEQGASVSLGPGVRSRVTAVTSTSVAVQLTVSTFAAEGFRTLTVTNPDGGSAARRRALHVDYAAVLVRWAVGQGAVGFTTTLRRPTFATAPSLRVAGAGVSATTTLGAGGTVEVTLGAAPDATPGWHAMTLVDGLSSWRVPHGVKVRLAPRVTAVTPLGDGATAVGVRVHGSGFESCRSSAPTLSISGTGVTVDAVHAALGNLMYAKLTVATDAAIGPRDVTLTNCDSRGTATWPGAFAVLGTPTITAVAPIALGVSRVEAFRGTNLTPATTLVVSGAGVALSHVRYVSPTRLRATVTVSGTAVTGLRDVTVTDVGPFGAPEASSTATGVLAIDALPTASSLAPAGIGGHTTVTLVVEGTGFERGATLGVDAAHGPDAGLRVARVRVVSHTELEASVTAYVAVLLGTDAVTVHNPDGGVTPALGLRTDPAPALVLTSSRTRAGALTASFAVPAGAPATERYTLRICANATLTARCVSRAARPGGTTVAGLRPGSAYFGGLTAPTDGTYFASASYAVGPRRATSRLRAPTVRRLALSAAGVLVVTFASAPGTPPGQPFRLTACRNAAMTQGCVVRRGYRSGAAGARLAGRRYFVTVTAAATPGYLAATSRVREVVRA